MPQRSIFKIVKSACVWTMWASVLASHHLDPLTLLWIASSYVGAYSFDQSKHPMVWIPSLTYTVLYPCVQADRWTVLVIVALLASIPWYTWIKRITVWAKSLYLMIQFVAMVVVLPQMVSPNVDVVWDEGLVINSLLIASTLAFWSGWNDRLDRTLDRDAGIKTPYNTFTTQTMLIVQLCNALCTFVAASWLPDRTVRLGLWILSCVRAMAVTSDRHWYETGGGWELGIVALLCVRVP